MQGRWLLPAATRLGSLGVICVCLGCAGKDLRIGYGQAGQIAKDTTIPGKFQAGECATFAHALHGKFRAAGIRSRVLTFSYDGLGFPHAVVTDQLALRSGKELFPPGGSHAAVIYEDAGRTYAMDNQSWMPQRIRAGSPLEMAAQVGGFNARVLRAQ